MAFQIRVRRWKHRNLAAKLQTEQVQANEVSKNYAQQAIHQAK